jgi:hypothetical protein
VLALDYHGKFKAPAKSHPILYRGPRVREGLQTQADTEQARRFWLRTTGSTFEARMRALGVPNVSAGMEDQGKCKDDAPGGRRKAGRRGQTEGKKEGNLKCHLAKTSRIAVLGISEVWASRKGMPDPMDNPEISPTRPDNGIFRGALKITLFGRQNVIRIFALSGFKAGRQAGRSFGWSVNRLPQLLLSPGKPLTANPDITSMLLRPRPSAFSLFLLFSPIYRLRNCLLSGVFLRRIKRINKFYY